jgi:hypothetical protein
VVALYLLMFLLEILRYRSSMYLRTAWVRTVERPSPHRSLRIAPSHR